MVLSADRKASIRTVRILAVILAAVMMITCMPLTASAKSSSSKYKIIPTYPVKAGKYYYMVKTYSENASLMRSSAKKSGYRKIMTLEPWERVAANGKYIYRVKNKSNSKARLVRYNAAGKKGKTVKKLSGKYSYWSLSAAYGKNIFLTKKTDMLELLTYRYNVKSKKVKKVRKDCGLGEGYPDDNSYKSGKYILASSYIDTAGFAPSEKTLYTLSLSGKISKVKYLGDSVDAVYIGKKLYYVKFDFNSDFSTIYVNVYRCSRNGSIAVCLGSGSFAFNEGIRYVKSLTAKSCVIEIEGTRYRCDYSTGTFVQCN